MTPVVKSAGRVLVAVAGVLLVALPSTLSAQHEDRRRAIGSWLVEDVLDADGGRTLRLTREEGDYSLDYHMNLRAGATAVESQGFMVWRLTCGQGGEESLDGGRAGVQAAALRARLADYLERCEAPAGEATALFQDFDRAFALLSSWAEETVSEAASMWEAAAAAEAAIAGAGDLSVDMNATDMTMDMNMTMDANATYETEMTVTNSIDPGRR